MFDGHNTRATLSFDQRIVLENQILPTAARWVRDYPPGSVLHRHGMQALRQWGEVAE